MIRIVVALFVFMLLSCSVRMADKKPSALRDFVQLREGSRVYYAKQETTNTSYRDFLSSLVLKDSSEWKACLYDSTGWVVGADNDGWALQKSYHANPAFDEYPIVNITAYGAAKYCEWLTRISTRANVVYRLPTLTEQRTLLAQIDTADFYTPDITKGRRGSFANLSYSSGGYRDDGIDGATYTTSVNSYPQNLRGATSIVGNVSEMNGEGYRIGGGWNERPSQVLTPVSMTGSDRGTGFRVFLELPD